jgi:hypothetical protein
VPDAREIVGDWYVVCANPDPAYHGKVATDYQIWSFLANGKARWVSHDERETETTNGTYTFNADSNWYEAVVDRGSAGVQVFCFRLKSPGLLHQCYWRNKTSGIERDADETYVQEGSREWVRREKVRLVEQVKRSVSAVDVRQLRVGRAYRVGRETPLMPELDPDDPIAALKRVRQIAARGKLKIMSVADKDGTVWYRVVAWSSDGTRVGVGWVNSTALLGQDVQPVQ